MIHPIIRGLEIHPKTQVKKCFEKNLKKKEIWRKKGNLMERPKKHQPSHWQTISHSDPQRPFLTNSTPPRFFSLFIFLSLSLSVSFYFSLVCLLPLSLIVCYAFCPFVFLLLLTFLLFCNFTFLFSVCYLLSLFTFLFLFLFLLPFSVFLSDASCEFLFLF